MKKLLVQLGISLAVLVAGAFVGVIVEQKRGKEETKIRYLDYDISYRRQVIDRPTIAGRKLEVFLDGKPIEHLSQVWVSIYNYSDQNYEKVPVFIELSPKTDDPLQIIAEDWVGPGGAPELVEHADVVHKPSVPGGSRYGYSLHVANKSAPFSDPVFRVSYLLLGKTEPKVDVAIRKPGLQERELDYGLVIIEQRSWLEEINPLASVLGMLTLYAVVMFVTFRIVRKKQAKQDEKLQAALIESLSQGEVQGVPIGQLEPSVLAGHIFKVVLRWRRESIPRIFRNISPIPKPEID